MRRFLITSPKFEGTAEVFFNTAEILCRIDCLSTNMDAETIRAFKKAIPATIQELITGSNFDRSTTIVEAGYRMTFEEFWKKYNKKINKARCIPIYDKLNDADTVLCCNGIDQYDKFLAKVRVRQKLDPENWLKQRAWENDWRNAS